MAFVHIRQRPALFAIHWSFVRGCAVVLLFASVAVAEGKNEQPKVLTIPLDEIWAWNMPGTRDIRQLERDKRPKQIRGRLSDEIARSLGDAPQKGNQAKDCFAVSGTGIEALREAHAVLAKGQKPQDSFPVDRGVCVVFFSYQTGSYVHLHKVERRGNVVEIYYRFVPHRTRNMTTHFALIPLEKPPLGKVSVEIIQSPMEQSSARPQLGDVWRNLGEQVICKSSIFTVVEDNKK